MGNAVGAQLESGREVALYAYVSRPRTNRMRLYEQLVRHVSYPFWMWKDGRVLILSYQRSQLEELHSDRWRSLQQSRLSVLLKHALQTVPYYRRIASKLDVGEANLHTVRLSQIPLLTKENVNRFGQDLVSDRYELGNLLQSSTGGSTGTPMRFMRTNECVARRKAQESIFDGMMGYRPGCRVGLFVAAAHTSGARPGLKQNIRNATCERMIRFDPNRACNSYLKDFQRQFEKHQPEYIRCFPNSLVLFAEYARSVGVCYDFVRGISVTGENVYDWQRGLFREVFGAPIFERYATKECGVIAGSEHGNDVMRVFTPGVLLEVVDRDGHPCLEDQVGRIVVTDLFNFAMPLIRYDIGDLGAVRMDKSSSSGGAVPLLSKLLGRDRDIIVDSDGIPRPGYLFVELIGQQETSAQFQFVQESRNRMSINSVAERKDSDVVERVLNGARDILGDKIEVVVNYVDRIERDPSGKYSYVISRLSRRERTANLGEA